MSTGSTRSYSSISTGTEEYNCVSIHTLNLNKLSAPYRKLIRKWYLEERTICHSLFRSASPSCLGHHLLLKLLFLFRSRTQCQITILNASCNKSEKHYIHSPQHWHCKYWIGDFQHNYSSSTVQSTQPLWPIYYIVHKKMQLQQLAYLLQHKY